MRRSLPPRHASIAIPGLETIGRIDYGLEGIPLIRANNRLDAMRLVGYATARDRMFQMDLLRRAPAGQLAEILGPDALAGDCRARMFGMQKVAATAVEQLPELQQLMLCAYADGVNAWLCSAPLAAFECELLGYQPQPWKALDSLLVLLGLFDQLCGEEGSKRTITVMERVLPLDVAKFLSSDEDPYALPLTGGSDARRPLGLVPVEALAGLRRNARSESWPDEGSFRIGSTAIGSNAWVVATQGNSALCANDLHLPLSTPNICYAVMYDDGGSRATGFMIPGFPVLISGCTDHIAWGVTNFCGDNLDLVMIRSPEQEPNQYITASGSRPFTYRTDRIDVRGARSTDIKFKDTCWGPVSSEQLLGADVAYRWTALNPKAIDLSFCLLQDQTTLEGALTHARGSGTPPLNVTVCDSQGNIGWTIAGRFPEVPEQRHSAFDGSMLAAQSLSLLPATELPIVLNPPCGFLATANNRTVGASFPHDIGRNFASGFRATRIAERLSANYKDNLAASLELQLDAASTFYDFYRGVLLDVIPDPPQEAWHTELREMLGRAEAEQAGVICFLGRLRDALAFALLSAWCADCRAAEPSFEYRWANMEAAIRAVLALRDERTFPFPSSFADWNTYILATAHCCLREILAKTARKALAQIVWKDFDQPDIRHVLSASRPDLSALLDLPIARQPGGYFMVRVSSSGYGAATRMVAKPGGQTWIQAPAGQSGNPLSRYYANFHRRWERGESLCVATSLDRISASVIASPAERPNS